MDYQYIFGNDQEGLSRSVAQKVNILSDAGTWGNLTYIELVELCSELYRGRPSLLLSSFSEM